MRFGVRECVFLAVLLAMPVSSYWFVFRPQNEEIAAAKKEIEHKELMLENLARATAHSNDLEKQNRRVREEIDRLEARFPSDKEVEVVLKQVADLARKSRLRLPRVKTGKPVAAARYMEQPLDMTIEGDFDDFYSFLLKVEKLDRITRILELDLQRLDDENGSMRAQFTLSIYFEPARGEAIG